MATLLEMKQKSTKEAMKIMEAWLNGKIILARSLEGTVPPHERIWVTIRYPSWNFANMEYKILEEEDVPKAA